MKPFRSLSRLSAVLAMAATLLAVAPLPATSAVLLTQKQLVQKSELVVRAVAESAESRWNDEGTAIMTRTTLRVTGAFKGKAPAKVTLEQLGGTVGDRTMVIEGDAHIVPGDEVVAFLKRGQSEIVHLTALAQAAYFVKNGKARRDLAGLSLFRSQEGKLVPLSPPKEEPVSIAQLAADVARAAKEAP
jgi:hypothetical protein